MWPPLAARTDYSATYSAPYSARINDSFAGGWAARLNYFTQFVNYFAAENLGTYTVVNTTLAPN